MAGCYQRTSTPRGHGHVAHARALPLISTFHPPTLRYLRSNLSTSVPRTILASNQNPVRHTSQTIKRHMARSRSHPSTDVPPQSTTHNSHLQRQRRHKQIHKQTEFTLFTKTPQATFMNRHVQQTSLPLPQQPLRAEYPLYYHLNRISLIPD